MFKGVGGLGNSPKESMLRLDTRKKSLLFLQVYSINAKYRNVLQKKRKTKAQCLCTALTELSPLITGRNKSPRKQQQHFVTSCPTNDVSYSNPVSISNI